MRSISRHLFVPFLMPMLPLSPLRCQLRLHGRYVLTSREVAHAISGALGKGLSGTVEPAVLLLADVTSSQAAPQLDVDRASMQALPSAMQTTQQVVVRMRCHTAGVCLPFYAVVSWTSLSASNAVPLRNARGPLPHAAASPIVVWTGAHVTLVLEGGHTRVEVPVVTLQSGEEGASVRAISVDRRHIYTAQVYSAELLKGSL